MKKKHNKNGFFRTQYVQSWRYLKESKYFIYSAMAIFFIFFLAGFLLPAPDFIQQQIFEMLQELLDQTEGMSHTELTGFIFLNNMQVSLFSMIFGIIFGIVPTLVAIFNGYVLGFVGILSVREGGFLVLLRLLPHGIFEIPAIFISIGLGIKLGTFIFKEEKGKSFSDYFWNSLRVFLFIVLPLLMVAAVIEGALIALGA